VRRYRSPKIINAIFIVLAIYLGIFWISLYIYQQILQAKIIKKTKITSAEGVCSLEKVRLGGVDQWILIRGEISANPVLLFLHGGPGAPLFPYAREIGTKTKLEKKFVVIYWEQRGTGKSYSTSIPATSMSISQLVSDANELIKYLKNRFRKNQVILIARSWGTIIGIKLVQKYPEHISNYIGIGQIVNPLANDSISYYHTLYLADVQRNQKALFDLKKIGPPPYTYKELINQRKWLTKFTRKFNNDYKNAEFQHNLLRLLSTPEYSLKDIFVMGLDPFFSLKHLWNKEYYQINLIEQIPKLEIPVCFLVGRHDYFTPGVLVKKYYDNLYSPKGKRFIWFENSGHQPEHDEPSKFYEVIIEEVLEKEQPTFNQLGPNPDMKNSSYLDLPNL
jgi:pimeloyl-ACP methyl ester carboxylesterase